MFECKRLIVHSHRTLGVKTIKMNTKKRNVTRKKKYQSSSSK